MHDRSILQILWSKNWKRRHRREILILFDHWVLVLDWLNDKLLALQAFIYFPVAHGPHELDIWWLQFNALKQVIVYRTVRLLSKWLIKPFEILRKNVIGVSVFDLLAVQVSVHLHLQLLQFDGPWDLVLVFGWFVKLQYFAFILSP